MEGLTHTQAMILDALRQFAVSGEPIPTYRELCTMFGWSSTGTARDHLQALAKKGLLELGDGRARRTRLTDRVLAPATPIRVLGVVAAGVPVTAEETDLGTVPAPSEWGQPLRLFALRVSGDSMRDIGILDGDIVVVRRQTFADDGAIVVATLDGGTTLKRLRVEMGRAVLIPENPDFSPIPVGEDGVSLHGIVVGLLRHLASPLSSACRTTSTNTRASQSDIKRLEKE